MKILIVTPFCYPGEGGLESHISNLSSGLMIKGHKVRVLSASSLPNPIRKTISALYHILNILIAGLGVIWQYWLLSHWFCLLVKLLHKREKYDLISIQHALLLKPVQKAVERNRVPIILTVHGDCANEILSEGLMKPDSYARRYLIELERYAYTNSDKIVTVDTRLRDHVLSFIETDNKISIIKNFVNAEIFAPAVKNHRQECLAKYRLPCDRHVLLCPRRLVRKNGVVGAAVALSYLVNQLNRQDVILVYAGQGGQKNEIIRIAVREKVLEYIVFLGSIKHSEMNSLYSTADIVLIPSTYSEGVVEATSISSIEAMACELPVIATNIGGLKELITNEENGILVDDGDHQGLAMAIDRIFNNPILRDRLSSHARKTVVDRHSHLYGAEQFLEVYRKAIDSFQKPTSCKALPS